MYISSVKIRNYRNFCDETFEMPLKPFTLIVGENNAGKTNLLNAICLIFNLEITAYKRRSMEIDDFNYETVKNFKRQIADDKISTDSLDFPFIKIEVTLKDIVDKQQAVVGDWYIDKDLTTAKITYLFSVRSDWAKKTEWLTQQRQRVNSKLIELNKTLNDIPDEQLVDLVDFPIDNYEYFLFGGDDSTNRCDTYYLRMLKMEFLDALRDAKRELIASGDYRLLYRILNRKDHSGYISIKAILESLESEIKRNKNLKEIKAQVSELLNTVSLQEKDANNSVDFSFSSPETSEILKKIGLTYGSSPVGVERNGLGRNNLLYISMILSQLQDNSSQNDYTCFRVIGIEEAEAHLHPTLQGHLAANIEAINKGNATMQLLLTSHSTHITAKLQLANTVVLFKDEGTGKMKYHYLLDGLNEKDDAETISYLQKYLDATKSTMLFSKRLILVEGISEQLLLPVFFQLCKKLSLDKINCAVLNVNGVAFSHFLKIISKGFYIKCLVLTDSDTEKKTENRADLLKEKFKDACHISIQKTSNSTFEKDIIESNKTGKGKEILLNALTKTKPINGKKFKENTDSKDIDIETFFCEIENYKSEFAFNLLELLNNDADGFTVPNYIQEGLNFIND